MREFIYCAKAGCRTRANIATGYCPQHRRASADTHPKDGDAKQAPALLSGAVGSEADETPR